MFPLPWHGMAPLSDNAPMTVWLAPAPLLMPEVPAAAEPEKWGQTRLSASGSQRQKVESDPIFPPALPKAPDPIYYAARDLDDYPRPLAPLRIGRPARTGAGEVRLELLIDEHGVVRNVVFTEPVQPSGAEEELRATLAATPFMPARRHGRAVKSRVLMSINFETGNR